MSFVVWFTGVSGSGKSTTAHSLAERLRLNGARVEILDGDVVRTRLSKDLGFSKADRDENVGRIGFVCELLARNGVAAIVAAISPYRDARDQLRKQIPNFVEVFMTCPLAVLEARDPKGLYRRALAGELPHFTGISDPYEAPTAADVTIDSSQVSREESVDKVWRRLVLLGLVTAS